MALEELPDAERTCSWCEHDDADSQAPCGGCSRAWNNGHTAGAPNDYWSETGRSVRERAEKRITELEAHVVQLRKLCADRPNLDHIPNQSVDIEHWFYMIDCAARGGR